MSTEVLFLIGVITAMAAGVTIVMMGLNQRNNQLEMRHRERMAMIERGLVPPPEMAGSYHDADEGRQVVTFQDKRRGAASRSQMTFGIVLIGAGLAFMTIVGIAADTPSVAIGIGGAFVVFGAALIVISQVTRPVETMTTAYPRHPVPTAPAPPPPPIPPDQNL